MKFSASCSRPIQVTVAVEVPIYLTPDELLEFKRVPGFNIPLRAM